MKKFILFSIIVLCTIFLYGCSDVTFQVKVDETGQIYQTATIQPDYELLKSKGFSKEYVNEEILKNYIIYIKN